jgi:toxin HigB-1
VFLTGKGAELFPPEVIKHFFTVMQIISDARDERGLYAFKGLRLEKLFGKRADQRSSSLNTQYWLTFEIFRDAQGNLLWICDLEDYH